MSALDGARSAPGPGHGQFYRLVRAGVWEAIDYTESRAYREAIPNRAIWLTYKSPWARASQAH
jgi:hypothetical protein